MRQAAALEPLPSLPCTKGPMNKKITALVSACILLAGIGYYVYFVHGTGSAPDSGASPGQTACLQDMPPSDFDDSDLEDQAQTMRNGQVAACPVEHPKDIEEIKKQIYDLEIEYVEDIPRLDEVVQTGDAPTRDFWKGGWMSVDDAKDMPNGFNLEPQKDGTFIFYPDEATTRTYTFFETPRTYAYDPVKKEFSWEIDYYGKTIIHRARFINDNVLAMMLISGRKVTLDIYQKQPDQPSQAETPSEAP